MIGVISSNRASQFGVSMNALTKPGYWNGLQGSVARWNSNTIMMAQTALPLPAQGLRTNSNVSISDKASELLSSTKNWISSLRPAPKPTAAPAKVSVSEQPTRQSAVIKLRGSIDPAALQSKNLRNPFANFELPSMEGLSNNIKSKYEASKVSINNMRTNGLDWRPIKKWAYARTQDRNTIIFIIILSMFLLLGMASPKLAND